MLAESGDAVLDGTNEELVGLEAMDDEVDSLYASIVGYLGRLSKQELHSYETEELFQLMEATNNLEAIGDIIENRPALSRWHPDYADAFSAYIDAD